MSESSKIQRDDRTESRRGRRDYSYKFNPPNPLSVFVSRDKLIEDSTTASQYSAVIIQGPAGHGKTTTLTQILAKARQLGWLTGWVTLDESDNDIAQFNYAIRTMIHNALGDAEKEPDNISSSDSGGAVESILNSLEAATQPVALFLDDYQNVNERINIDLLEVLIERCPPNVTFFIGSRSIPDLVSGRLMISGRAKWVPPRELRFTWQEVQSFLAQAGLDVSEAEAEAFWKRTEGWPAILQLLQLALRGGKVDRHSLLSWVSGATKDLTQYLAKNVLTDLPPDRRRFLLRTCLLDRFSAELCEELTGESNAAEILQELVARGLFIRSIDVAQEWFEYHSIFSDYLKSQLEAEAPREVKDLHRIAAHWLKNHDCDEEAIPHAVAAGELDFAADMLNTLGPELVRLARLRKMKQLSALLPLEYFKARPILSVAHIWAMAFLHEHEKVQGLLDYIKSITYTDDASEEQKTSVHILRGGVAIHRDDLHEHLELTEQVDLKTSRDLSKFQLFEFGALANIKAIYDLRAGRLQEARELALTGESLGERGESSFSGGYSSSLIALSMILSGQLQQAIRHLRESLNAVLLRVEGSFASAAISTLLGHALYESGDYVGAESLLSDVLDMASQTLPPDWLILAYLSLSRASAVVQDDVVDSFAVLDEGEKLALIRRYPRMVRAMRRERLRLTLQKGDSMEAKSLASLPGAGASGDAVPPEGWIHLAENCDDDRIAEVRMHIHHGDGTAAVKKIDAELNHAIEFGRVQRQIKLRILKAVALQDANAPPEAVGEIIKAVSLAAPQGYVSTFRLEGKKCFDLLYEALTHTSTSAEEVEFIQSVLSDGKSDYNVEDLSPTRQLEIQPLTKREKDVLSLVVSGATNHEIADRLFVSYNTVKFHMKNLYGKLDAKNRTHLSSRAQDLGLL